MASELHVKENEQNQPTYAALMSDLETRGFLKIGSVGHFEKEAVATLHATIPNLTR